MRQMKKWMQAGILPLGLTMTSCQGLVDAVFGVEGSPVSTTPEKAQNDGIDYSQKSSWYKLPAITKQFDTFYIYSTIYFAGNENDPDYATLDNREMLDGIKVEHAIKSSVFEESTNLFIPLYRQASMRLAGDTWKNTGSIEEAIKSKIGRAHV